jgi:hypothetical protein
MSVDNKKGLKIARYWTKQEGETKLTHVMSTSLWQRFRVPQQSNFDDNSWSGFSGVNKLHHATIITYSDLESIAESQFYMYPENSHVFICGLRLPSSFSGVLFVVLEMLRCISNGFLARSHPSFFVAPILT